jgi:hypothetical protein
MTLGQRYTRPIDFTRKPTQSTVYVEPPGLMPTAIQKNGFFGPSDLRNKRLSAHNGSIS